MKTLLSGGAALTLALAITAPASAQRYTYACEGKQGVYFIEAACKVKP